eukprot:m.121966 g.121966  ORF g.121966 m.121966 type:complete len:54 (-) comp11096_c0_seq1:156-317(-)
MTTAPSTRDGNNVTTVVHMTAAHASNMAVCDVDVMSQRPLAHCDVECKDNKQD